MAQSNRSAAFSYRLVLVLVCLLLGPAGFAYFHLADWFAVSQCQLWRIDASVSLSCNRRRSKDDLLYAPYTSNDPPSIVQLSKLLESSRTTATSTPPNQDGSRWNGSVWVDADGKQQSAAILQVVPNSDNIPTTDSRQSLRQQVPNGQSTPRVFQNPSVTRPTILPMTTSLLLLLQLFIFYYLWKYRIDPNIVTLNGKIVQDFGRSLSGHLSHFEPWHLGMNMMTLWNLGGALEQYLLYGSSISLLLYTISFLPLTTLVIIGLVQVKNRIQQQRGNGTSSANFPSMVGFSGILFAWSVVTTLEQGRSCPVFFLPSLCFPTIHLGLGFHVSLGPLVQLVMLQVILPRVSFLGHLAGIVVGFLWHWKLLPPLVLLQPAIFYPILWLIAKRLPWCKRFVLDFAESSNGSTTTSYTPRGSRLGGDVSLGYAKLSLLRYVLFFHSIALWRTVGIKSDLVWSQFLQLVMLSFYLLDVSHQQQSGDMRVDEMGRGYMSMTFVWLLTDGLTLGGWWFTRSIWSDMSYAVTLIILRMGLTMSSNFVVCYILYNSNASSTGDGPWHLILEPFVSTCHPIGDTLSHWVFVPRKMGSRIASEGSPISDSAPSRREEVSALV